jgi:hypothetical protein
MSSSRNGSGGESYNVNVYPKDFIDMVNQVRDQADQQEIQ